MLPLEDTLGENEPRPLAIDVLKRAEPLDEAAVARFLAGHALPIVEGPCVTFVYHGEAEAVYLKHWVYGLPSSQAFERLAGTRLWHLTLELPHGSRVEYKLEVVRGGHGEWIEDPLNPLKSHDPFGSNSVCHATGYVTPDWTEPDPEAREGRLEELSLRSSALHAMRQVTLYLPARFRRTRRYPLVIAHDGGDFLKYASFKTVLDNLIHRLEIPELVVALTHPGERLVEYADDERHARYLSEELVPRLERRLPLIGAPEGRCLMGASFGGVASFSTAWRYPGYYSRLLLLSGSFAFTDIGPSRRGPSFDPVVRFMNAYRSRPAAVAEKVFVGCGVYESLIYENRSLVPLLQATGMQLRYVEAKDGHNWENWRDRMREALSWLYPGPLWMVYE